MIVVILTKNRKDTLHSFDTLAEALSFARSNEPGSSFKIRMVEDGSLLAKGKLSEVGDNYDDLEEVYDDYE